MSSDNDCEMTILSEETDSSLRPSQDSSETIELSGTDSDVMIVDEVPAIMRFKDVTKKKQAGSSRDKKSEITRQVASNNQQVFKQPSTLNGNSSMQQSTSSSTKAKKISRAEKSKAEKRDLLSNPDKIVENILSKSSFEVPNLSRLVDEKFKSADFREIVSQALENIKYEDITNDLDMSVLPTKFNNYTVNLSPCALTYLPDMYEIPQRWKRKGSQNDNRKRLKANDSSKKQDQQNQSPNQTNQQQGQKRQPPPQSQQRHNQPKQNPQQSHQQQQPLQQKQNQKSNQQPKHQKNQRPQPQSNGNQQNQKKRSKRKRKQSQSEGQEQQESEAQQQQSTARTIGIKKLSSFIKQRRQQLESNQNGEAQSRSQQRQQASSSFDSSHQAASSSNGGIKFGNKTRSRSRKQRNSDLRTEVLGHLNQEMQQHMSRRARNKSKKRKPLTRD